jgi:hypothetical protein
MCKERCLFTSPCNRKFQVNGEGGGSAGGGATHVKPNPYKAPAQLGAALYDPHLMQLVCSSLVVNSGERGASLLKCTVREVLQWKQTCRSDA